MKKCHKAECEMKTKVIPPDGGWGWMVVLGFALNNLIMIPSISGIGMIFKDIFPIFKISPTEATIIMSTNMSFGMLMGLTHGPLLRIYGYRKIAISGTLMFSAGLIMTAFATKFTHFLISHGIVTSFGIGLGMAAFSLALNTYFQEKRGRAMGVAMTFTGLGPILMPQLVSVLLNSYTAQGTIIILGGLALHTIVASLLLQPIKWHAKRLVNHPGDDNGTIEQNGIGENVKTDFIAVNDDENLKLNVSNLKLKLNGDCGNEDSTLLKIVEENNETKTIIINQPNIGKSIESINLGSCLMIYDELMIYERKQIGNLAHKCDKKNRITKEKDYINNYYESYNKLEMDIDVEETKLRNEKSQNSVCFCSYIIKCMHRVINFFDLTLLCDPIYVNMMLGISMTTFAETNFSILIPFILGEMHFTITQIATVMSAMAAVDLLMRGLAPFVGEWLHQTPRKMSLVSLVMLFICRSALIYYTSFVAVLVISIGIGFAKGFRSVFMSIIVPNYIPIERLPHATGIQIFVNGLLLMALGPLMGVLTELMGSFVPCIIVINFMTILTIVMWFVEMCITNRSIASLKKTKNMEYNIRQQ